MEQNTRFPNKQQQYPTLMTLPQNATYVALPLQVSHKSRYRLLWRYAYQHVYMILAYLRFMDSHTFPFTQLPQYLSDCHFLFSKEYLSTIFVNSQSKDHCGIYFRNSLSQSNR